jgi:hypothetical protein
MTTRAPVTTSSLRLSWQGHAAGWPAGRVLVGTAAALAGSAALLATAATHTSSTARVVLLTGVVLAAVAVLLALIEALAAARVSVEITPFLVRVRPGLFPFGGFTIPVRTVRYARAVHARAHPWQSLGWWWTRPGDSVSPRTGPALALETVSGGLIVISVDQPGTAALVLARLRRW